MIPINIALRAKVLISCNADLQEILMRNQFNHTYKACYALKLHLLEVPSYDFHFLKLHVR